jgi:hypothetical protein
MSGSIYNIFIKIKTAMHNSQVINLLAQGPAPQISVLAHVYVRY